MAAWVDRNEDKPHRCPGCHAVATWNRLVYGPRTRITCPRGCDIQWRIGCRALRSDLRSFRAFLARLDDLLDDDAPQPQ